MLYKASFFLISSSCVNTFPCCVMSSWILNYEFPWTWITAFIRVTIYLKVLTFKWNPYKFLLFEFMFLPVSISMFWFLNEFFQQSSQFQNIVDFVLFLLVHCFCLVCFLHTKVGGEGVVYMDKWSYLNNQTCVSLDWNFMLWNRTLYLWSLHRFGFFFLMMGQSNWLIAKGKDWTGDWVLGDNNV